MATRNQVDESNVCVSVIFKDETFWLSQKAMAELFDCTADNISLADLSWQDIPKYTGFF